MQNINNNMDELFRKAAANYPLKTVDSDWDHIAARLLNPSTAPFTIPEKNNTPKKGRFRMLVLLMLFTGIIFIPPVKYRQPSNIQSSGTVPKVISPPAAEARGHSLFAIKSRYRHTTGSAGNKRPGPTPLPVNESFNAKQLPAASYRTGRISLPCNTDNPAAANIARLNRLPCQFNTTIDQTANATVNKEHAEQGRGNMYWGIVMGPSFNRVKNQALRKPGFDIGIMGGMMLNNKLALETGILFTKKYYFSDGKYFSMDKAGTSMPAGMTILSLEGSSTLFEMPVRLKYKMLEKNGSRIFSLVGISSYLMVDEKNDYHTMMNGAEQNMTGWYKDAYRYFAVMANLGLEYDHKISKYTRIKIEPYLQIPLKGIGQGSMPVATAGIHIGFMRTVH